MKVRVVCPRNHGLDFQEDLNRELENLEKQGYEIIDIKFSMGEPTGSLGNGRFNAMIIYK